MYSMTFICTHHIIFQNLKNSCDCVLVFDQNSNMLHTCSILVFLLFSSDLVNQMSASYNLPLRVAYSASRGFHIQLYSAPSDGFTAENLPAVFIKVTKFKNTFSFTTIDLVSLCFPFLPNLIEICRPC